jgi:LCP family protein required for cell wall assembly
LPPADVTGGDPGPGDVEGASAPEGEPSAGPPREPSDDATAELAESAEPAETTEADVTVELAAVAEHPETGEPADGAEPDGTAEAAEMDEPAGTAAAALPPPASRKPPGRDPLWARLLIVFGALMIVAASSVITATEVLANRYDAAVKKGTLLAPQARTGGDEAPRTRVTGPLNYLLIGSDARADDPTAGQRSDTIIIVHVPSSMDRAYLISVPRDLRVQIPPFQKTGFLGGREKINGAFEHGGGGEGGVQLLSATLHDLTGIEFDGAAVVDFGGFEKVVTQLGGVNMCIDERTESQHIGHDKKGTFLAPWYGPDGSYRNYESTPEVYEPGCRRLEPWQALDYSRQRKSIPDGDYGRQRHQQQLLKAIFDEARRQGVATSPRKLDSLIRSVGSSLTVDTDGVDLADLVYALRGINPGDLAGIKVPSEPQDIGGISYVVAFEEQSTALYEATRRDRLDVWVQDNTNWVNSL